MNKKKPGVHEAEGKIRNLEILHSIGKDISENLDLQIIMQKVTDASTNLTGAAFGAFFYNNQDNEGDSFSLFTLSGAPRKAFEKFGIPRHTDIFRPTFVENKTIRAQDIRKDFRYGKNSPHYGMPEGHLPVVSYLAVPVVSKSGETIGGLLFGHPEKGVFKEEHEEMVLDIASQAAIALDNSRLYEKVKELNKKKDEFIALASHELKTPLTTAKVYLQILQKKEERNESLIFIQKALDQINKLQNLVDDLLNVSRIEAGQMEYNMEIFDLKEMIEEITHAFLHTSQTHDFALSLPDKPVLVKGDKTRIEQVAVNFISNAVKYSPEEKKVSVVLKTEGTQATVEVQDSGIGMTKQQQKGLFSRFYRAENTKGFSGLGLGLYLSKQIIDRHNGIIGVVSEPKKGSSFFFSLQMEE